MNAEQITIRPLLTVKDMARVLGIHERTVWRMAAQAEAGVTGFPRPVRIGRKTVRWRREDVEAYIEALAAGA